MEKLLYTVADIQEICSLGRTKVYELLRTHELPSIRVGRVLRIPAKSLEEWIEKQQKKEA
jgi:excisionase family DNA binding protein